MKVICPNCRTNYSIDERRIPPSGAKLKCAKCQGMFPVKPQAAPAPEPPASDPLGPSAATPFSPSGVEEGGAAVPLPGGPSRAESIPLPGLGQAPASSFAASPPPAWSEPGEGAVPLPGVTAPRPQAQDWEEQQTRMITGSALADLLDQVHAQAVPLPGQAASVPLPGGAVPPPHFPPPMAPPPPLVPPAPISTGPDPFADLEGPPPAEPPPAAPRATMMFGSAAAESLDPPQPGPGELDFSDLGDSPAPSAPEAPLEPTRVAPTSHPAATQQSFPAPVSFDFSDLPVPAGQAPAEAAPSFDFEDLPSPAPEAPAPPKSPAPFELELGDFLPSPAAPQDLPAPAAPSGLDDFGLDFAAPPAPAPSAPASFGEVDLSPPPAAEAPASDGLEFDPTGSAPVSGDLEADFSAPASAPAPAGAADGLEMLNFIDETAKEAKGEPRAQVSRFHIRRRSGKVFGPFDEGVVVKMIEDGQLLGNEDVSPDSERWSPIGGVPSFAAAIRTLLDGPAGAGNAPPTVSEGDSASPSSASVEKLKQLYEGRMAAVAVVDSHSAAAKLREKLPWLIGASALLLVLGSGAGLGATRYGFFGLKLLLPAKVSPGTPEFADLQKAQKALLADTYKSYQEARDAALSALKKKEYPQARALWCQAVFYLQRRYAAATPKELKQAAEALPGLQFLGKKHPEVVKALAGKALMDRAADGALVLLDDALARADNQGDLELSFLRAEAHALKGQGKLAADALNRLLQKQKDSAKALHALGNLHQAGKDAEQAAKAYEEALRADPSHAISAVELAAIELLIRKDTAGAFAALEQALSPAHQQLLGPAELTRALSLKARALARQFKLEEAASVYQEALKHDPNSVFAKAGLAQLHLTRREPQKAVPLLKEATEREPANLEYTDGYLSALIGTGKMEDALKQVESANTRFPGNARLAYLAARVDDALDRPKEAESHYLRAANADPSLFEANLHLARLHLRQKKVAEARQQLEAAEKKAPENAAVLVGLGELALAEREVEKSEQLFQRAASLDPSLSEAQLGLSAVALERGQAARALPPAEKALELDPSVKNGRLQKGLVLWKLQRLEDAVAELEKAKSLDPRGPKVLIALGAVKLDKGDTAGSEASLLAALGREPSNAEAHYYLARAKAKRAEFTQAIESMRTALQYADRRPDYHYQMGLIYREARRMSDAMASWKAALKIDPSYPDALEALGRAHLDRSEAEEAIRHFEQVLKADPQRSQVHASIGDAHFLATRWQPAIASYLKALEADPSLTQTYFKLARAYTEKGRHSEAINWYRKATSLEPKNPTPWYYLAFAYKERGLRKEAVAAFKSYLERKPEAEDRREVEDEIYDLEHP